MLPTFTKNELFVMMQTLNVNVLVGFSNPFKDLSKQEIELEWEKAYKGLHRRGLIDLVDGEIKLEDRFAEALWIMSRTNLTAEILTDQKRKSLFYFGEENVVECTHVSGNNYTLYMHGTPSTTWNNVIYPRMLAGVEEHKVHSKSSVFIPPALYSDFLNKGTYAASKEIEKFNDHRDVSRVVRQLNHSIKHKIHNNRFMMFYKHQRKWEIEGLHILTSPTKNWVLKMVNKNNMELLEAKQSSNVEIVVEILNVMRRVQKEQVES